MSVNTVVEVFLLLSAQRDLDRLEGEDYGRILGKIRELGREPRPRGSVKLTDEEGYRIRVGDFRILYRIDDAAKKIFIYRIKHRREVYSRP
jgi:mRNA interferase RelE/StbE